MKRVLLWILGGALALVALVFGVGAVLPREHVVTSAITIHQPPESVWAVVRDLGATPRWWDETTSSVALDDPAGREVWRQEAGDFSMDLVVAEDVAPTRLVTSIEAKPGAAFGGAWTYTLTPVAGSTRVAVTETGWVANPAFRTMGRIMGYHTTLDSYLRALGRRFGESVTPEHLASE